MATNCIIITLQINYNTEVFTISQCHVYICIIFYIISINLTNKSVIYLAMNYVPSESYYFSRSQFM